MRRVLLLLLCAMLVAHNAGAQSGQPDIKEIKVVNGGAGKVDDSYVLTQVKSHVDSPYDVSMIDKDVKRLLATGSFSDVRVEAETIPGGVRLNFILKNKYVLVEPVKITGVSEFSESKVRDLLGLDTSDLVDDQVMGTRIQKVVDEYRSDHFVNASVNWTIEEVSREQGTARVSVEVDEGRKSAIGSVIIEGNKAIPYSPLRDTMKHVVWWNPFTWFGRHKYDPDELEAARVQMRDIYTKDGYLDVQVGQPVVAPDEKGDMKVSFSIVEGVCYKYGNVKIEGNKLFPESADLRKVLEPVRKGETASSVTTETARQAIRDYYGSRGYVNTLVRVILKTDPQTGVADVVFSITEGKLMKIRNLYIRGNAHTRDKVIRRELLVSPGEIYNEVQIRRSERIVNNLGFFSSVRSYPEETRYDDKNDLVFEVEEKSAGNLMVGMGFSSIDHLMGYMEISQGNFDLFGWPYLTGGGQKIRLRAEASSSTKNYELSFTEPWFMDRKLSMQTDLYSSESNYSDYTVKRLGGAIGFGKPLPGHNNRVDLRYKIERVSLSDIADTNEYVFVEPPKDKYFFTDENRETREGSLSLTVAHDGRDSPLFPRNGYNVSMNGTVASEYLWSEVDMYSLTLRGTAYQKLWLSHYLGFSARCQVIDSYGDTSTIPLGDRLFLGGGNSIRGLDYRDVGPKVVPVNPGPDVVDHRTVGGNSLVLGSVEYNIPIVENIRFSAFYDTGNVWRDSYEFHMGELAETWGMGIRFDIPGFPVRIDRAWPIRKDSDLTGTQGWVFWIGPQF